MLTHLLQILIYKHFKKESIESGYVFALVATNSFTMISESSVTHSPNVSHLLDEFSDVMPDELPDKLSPLRDIQHTIDLVLRFQLPNLPHYRMNHVKRAELYKQIEGLLEKDFVRHSFSPCVILV